MPGNTAIDNQAEARPGRRNRADCDVTIGGADHDCRRSAIRHDFRAAFLGVLDPVLVLVGVVLVGILGRDRKVDALGDIAFDHQRAAALEQVIVVELGRVRRRSRIAIAGRRDGALDHQRAIDIAAQMRGGRAFPGC